MSKFRNLLFVLFATGLAMGSRPALADTATTNLLVSALVVKACLVAATPLAFGTYDTLGPGNSDNTATLTVTCTLGTSFTVGLGAGSSTGATVTTRAMTGLLGGHLSYGLFQNTSRTTNWGNTPGTDTPAAIVAGALPSLLTVYGRVPARQSVAADAYTDTVVVTVNF